MGEVSGFVVLLITVFVIILTVLWIVLPFAVFGIKRRIDTIIEQAIDANARLKKIERKLVAPISDPSGNIPAPATETDQVQAWPSR